MLVTRKDREAVQIGQGITVSVNWARRGKVSLAILAPRGTRIKRL